MFELPYLTIKFSQSITKSIKKKSQKKWKSHACQDENHVKFEQRRKNNPPSMQETFQIDFEFESWRKYIQDRRKKLRTKIIIKYVFIFYEPNLSLVGGGGSFLFWGAVVFCLKEKYMIDKKYEFSVYSFTYTSSTWNNFRLNTFSDQREKNSSHFAISYFLSFDILCMWTLSIVFYEAFSHTKWMKFNDSAFMQKNWELCVDWSTLSISHQHYYITKKAESPSRNLYSEYRRLFLIAREAKYSSLPEAWKNNKAAKVNVPHRGETFHWHSNLIYRITVAQSHWLCSSFIPFNVFYYPHLWWRI